MGLKKGKGQEEKAGEEATYRSYEDTTALGSITNMFMVEVSNTENNFFKSGLKIITSILLSITFFVKHGMKGLQVRFKGTTVMGEYLLGDFHLSYA